MFNDQPIRLSFAAAVMLAGTSFAGGPWSPPRCGIRACCSVPRLLELRLCNGAPARTGAALGCSAVV